mmetsp:Transcript_48214/g.148824  ORF Transcript_48214/g.148824 Transcript_48214/m.148824 type:complete len:703 (-) Transcript_48214:52-2160(-)
MALRALLLAGLLATLTSARRVQTGTARLESSAEHQDSLRSELIASQRLEQVKAVLREGRAKANELALHGLTRAKTSALFTWGWLFESPFRPWAVGLAIFVGLGLCRTAANLDMRISEKVAEVCAKRDELQENIDTLATDMEATLQNMAESNAYLAERNFESKLRDVRRFLKKVSEGSRVGEPSAGLDDPEAAAPFRKYILQWVTVYQECELEAGPPPKALSQALQRLARASDVASYVSKWLEDKKPKLVETALQRFSTKSWEKPQREPLPPLYQHNYFLTISALLVGGALAVAAASHGDLCAAAFGFASFLMSPFAFVQPGNQVARLTAEIKQLEERSAAVEAYHEEVTQVFSRAEQSTNMWMLRTVPHMDMLKEVHDVVLFMPKEQAASFLQRATASLDLVSQALGPLEIWTGERALSERELMVVASQLTDKLGGISPKQARDKKTFVCRVTGKVTSSVKKAALGQRRELTRKEIRAKVDDWVSPSEATRCDEPTCRREFWMTTKRKNCRCCGKVFCKTCTQKMPIPKLGYYESERVCNKCAEKLKKQSADEKMMAMSQVALPPALSGVVQLGFLRVRINAASNLKTEVGRPPNSYVRLRLSETAEWVQTVTVRGTFNPQWTDEEFFFPVRANDTTLMIQVVDDSVPNSMENMLGFLGSLDTKFRAAGSNEWTLMRCPLEGRKTGMLEFDLRFAEDAWHLL